MEGKPISFLEMLGLLLIGLKLAGSIEWSWWSVLCPIYIPWSMAFLIGLWTVFTRAVKLRRGLAK